MAYNFEYCQTGEVQETLQQKVLYGHRVQNNPVPTWTAENRRKPFVIFEDPITKKKIGFQKYMLARGVLELGAAGTGKTNLNLMLETAILKTMEENAIHIVFDPKGDYFDAFMKKIPSELRHVIASEKLYKEITNYWNMFAEIMPRGANGRLVYTFECDEAALEVSSSLFQEIQSKDQPVFPIMAKQLLAALIIYFIKINWRNSPEKLNNKSFLKFIYSLESKDIKKILEMEGMEEQRSCMNYISGGQSGNQTQGVLSYMNAVLRKVFVGPFAESDSKRELSMRDIFESKKGAIIFIKYDLMRGNTLGPMYKILIDFALKYSLGNLGGEKRNLYLLIDEWAQLPKLEYMSTALSYGRSQGVKVICGIQNVSALTAIYGEKEAASILAGFQTVVGFRVADYPSRQFMSKHFGENYHNISFETQNQNMQAQREGYSLEDWEILSLKCGQAAISMVDEKPFFFTFPEFQGENKS